MPRSILECGVKCGPAILCSPNDTDQELIIVVTSYNFKNIILKGSCRLEG